MDYSNLTFNDDKLQRNTFVKNLMNIIDKWHDIEHENNSLVMSLDSPWGSGKSYLVNMWKNWLLENESFNHKYNVIYYNAWENDDNDNAFIPLVYKLQEMDLYEEDNKMAENLKTKSKEFLKYCGVAIIKDSIKKAIGEETANILIEGIDKGAKAKPITFFDKYREYMSQKRKFIEALSNLIPDTDNNDGKLIVFVDELDRCRPTFAVETLEIVKHYFNIENVVFIFSVDLEQLAHSITTMYGQDMDSPGYLRRFFDININIPDPNIKEYFKYILEDKIDKLNIAPKFIDIATNIYTKLNLSLRDIDKITNNFTIFCLYYKNDIETKRVQGGSNDMLEVYLYFIVLKYKYPNIYSMILKEDFMAYDNSPKNWPIIEAKYFVSPNINSILKSMQIGGARKIGSELIEKYGICENTYGNLSFAEYIERTIEMFG